LFLSIVLVADYQKREEKGVPAAPSKRNLVQHVPVICTKLK
jgi:hypothetical protein